MEFFSSAWFSALAAIVLIDLVLAGDNAIVIALAARQLPASLQRKAIVWGTLGAIVLRSLMTLVVLWLLRIPGLMGLGGLGLLWIAYALLVPKADGGAHAAPVTTFWAAMWTIVAADALMGIDNVLGVAGAAKGSFELVVIGLVISVPIVVWGSTLVLRLIERFPAIVYLGAAMLAYTAAHMITAEPLLAGVFDGSAWRRYGLHAALIVAVLGLAAVMRRRRRNPTAPSRSGPAAPPAGPGHFGETHADQPAASGRLGPYRIEREIGHGAMGTVYLCRDPRSDRAVAVKTMALKREFAGRSLDEARERFFREAGMAGRLRHPDIVAVHEAGEAEGLAYIAMEYALGHDLLRHTVPGRLLPAPLVLQLLARVARALAHAHRQGVVHRDVKPANVIVEASDSAITAVKVTDFGIARITDAARTRTGLMLGTPAFMSPEQLMGDRLDGRTDLYSLGVMGFQLLTGALPHPADSMATLMKQIANEPAPDLRSLRPDLPEALARALARALQKQPAQRHADGDAMAAELEAIVLPAERAERPESSPFEATQALPRLDPRHNAGD